MLKMSKNRNPANVDKTNGLHDSYRYYSFYHKWPPHLHITPSRSTLHLHSFSPNSNSSPISSSLYNNNNCFCEYSLSSFSSTTKFFIGTIIQNNRLLILFTIFLFLISTSIIKIGVNCDDNKLLSSKSAIPNLDYRNFSKHLSKLFLVDSNIENNTVVDVDDSGGGSEDDEDDDDKESSDDNNLFTFYSEQVDETSLQPSAASLFHNNNKFRLSSFSPTVDPHQPDQSVRTAGNGNLFPFLSPSSNLPFANLKYFARHQHLQALTSTTAATTAAATVSPAANIEITTIDASPNSFSSFSPSSSSWSKTIPSHPSLSLLSPSPPMKSIIITSLTNNSKTDLLSLLEVSSTNFPPNNINAIILAATDATIPATSTVVTNFTEPSSHVFGDIGLRLDDRHVNGNGVDRVEHRYPDTSLNVSQSTPLHNPLHRNQLAQTDLNMSLINTTSTPSPSSTTVDLLSSDSELPEAVIFMLPQVLRITATVVCLIVLFFGVSGNILVPLVVCRTRELCTNSTNVFLINLSIADLLVLVVCMPTVLIELHSKPEVWTLGKAMCKAVPFLELVVAHGSILTILAISFERYYAICKPLKASYKCTIRRAVITIGCLWSIAFVATIPVLFGTELVEAVYIDGSLVSVCITKANAPWQKFYFLGSMTCFFWIPFLILIIVYCIIAKRLVSDDRRLLMVSTPHSSISGGASLVNIRSSLACVSSASGSFSKESSVWPVILWRCRRSSQDGYTSRNGSTNVPPVSGRLTNINAEKVQMRSRRQVVLMLVAVVVCFFACLLPFRLFTLWLLVTSEEEIRALSMERFYNLLYFCRIMLYVNSMLNPFLYAVVSSKFRNAFVEAVCQYCCYYNDCLCCCCDEEDDLDFNKGMGPRGKMRRRYRRNRRFLMRQSTFNTTTTTNTSNSLKNSSMHSASNNVDYQSGKISSSMDSILATRPKLQPQPSLNLSQQQPQQTHQQKQLQQQRQHSFDLGLTQHNSNLNSNGIITTATNSAYQHQIQSRQSATDDVNADNKLPVSLLAAQYRIDDSPSALIHNHHYTNSPMSPVIMPLNNNETSNISQSTESSNTTIIASKPPIAASGISTTSSPPSAPSKLNTISQYPADYRRAIMMKRTSRVAIIDEDSDDEIHNQNRHYHNYHNDNSKRLHNSSTQEQFLDASCEEFTDNNIEVNANNNNVQIIEDVINNNNNDNDDNEELGDSDEPIPNIEEILSDPQFSTYESYV